MSVGSGFFPASRSINTSRNADDFLYRRIPAEQRRLVTAEFVPGEVPGTELMVRWDIVLGMA